MNKLKIAFVYASSPFYSGNHYDNTLYHFYNAVKRNRDLEVFEYPFTGTFDCAILRDKHDIILTDRDPYCLARELIGYKNLHIPIVTRIGDPHAARVNPYTDFQNVYSFGFIPPSYVRKYYPAKLPYEMIIFGLEPSLYRNLTPFKDRVKDRILNTGITAPRYLPLRVIARIKRPRTHAMRFYKLRTICNRLPYVDYTWPWKHEFIGDKYPQLLQKYRAAIAAMTTYPTIKYWETPAAECLTFMEVTLENDGAVLGHRDGETAIFINERNYEQKFEEYLADPDNPKWQDIAKAGRQYSIDNFSNDRAVEKLVALFRSIS